MDGWTDPKQQSIWAFMIITPSRKEYLYSLQNFSSDTILGDGIKDSVFQELTTTALSIWKLWGHKVNSCRELLRQFRSYCICLTRLPTMLSSPLHLNHLLIGGKLFLMVAISYN